MVDGELFEKIEYVASMLRNQAPFGGIQLVICGDFMQLPPGKCFSSFEISLFLLDYSYSKYQV